MQTAGAVAGQVVKRPTGDSKSTYGWVALGAATIFLLFANGRNNVAVAAWLAPVFLLRFTRTALRWWHMLAACVVLALTWAFQFRGMVPVPPVLMVIIATVYGLIAAVPYLIDRLVSPRVAGFLAALVLPCSWVAAEYLNEKFGPYGTWGSAAYSQYGDLPLMQVVSITGLWGISFLIAWFAAVVNWAWERDFNWSQVRRGALVFAGVVCAVLIYGGVRLVSFPANAPTVRVASLTWKDKRLFPSDDAARRAFTGGTLTNEEINEIRVRTADVNDDLFARAAREADAGARIVFWGEANSFTFSNEEAALLRRGSELARSHGIYLGMAILSWHLEQKKPMENKVVLIAPDGNIQFEFHKAHPVPGSEAALTIPGDGKVRVVDTPYGRLGSVICFDADSSSLLQQAGRNRADLIIIPSNDWREIDPWHTQMAAFRAVEQGFNEVRHVSNGLSMAVDYEGRVLGVMDHYAVADGSRNLVVQVPTRGVRTIYSRIGDLFAWLCIAGVVLLAVLAVRGRRPTPLTR